MLSSRKTNLLIVICGSIAAYKSCYLISLLKKNSSFRIKTVTTKSALKFVGESSLEGLTGEKNHSELFELGGAMDHIELGRWADVMLVYPASANFINRIALGLADDLASSIFLAWPTEKPLLMAPAMNTRMWEHFSVQKSLSVLGAQGIQVLEPQSGSLACGEVGAGRLIEPEEVELRLTTKAKDSKRVLVIYGGTTERIDSVRSITNTSTGKTGQFIAEYLLRSNFSVDGLRSVRAPQALGVNQDLQFDTYVDLSHRLCSCLKANEYDLVVNLAAISDYSVGEIHGADVAVGSQARKISSEGSLHLTLNKNEKILPKIKGWASNEPLVVGFKLLVDASDAELKTSVRKVFSSGGVDFVVSNDLRSISAEKHQFKLHANSGVVLEGGTKKMMAKSIRQLLLSDKLASESKVKEERSEPRETEASGVGVNLV